jgi:hypothetical protein
MAKELHKQFSCYWTKQAPIVGESLWRCKDMSIRRREWPSRLSLAATSCLPARSDRDHGGDRSVDYSLVYTQ